MLMFIPVERRTLPYPAASLAKSMPAILVIKVGPGDMKKSSPSMKKCLTNMSRTLLYI
jgi:hypothetical protein